MQEKKENKKILIIHGPNLNMLGKREPDIYGTTTLKKLDSDLINLGGHLDLEIETFQSNHEGRIVDKIQQAAGVCHAVIINPAAYTHTSIAIRDALLATDMTVIEVHLSNIYKRESFRQKSMIADIAAGRICGFGVQGYHMALEAAAKMLK